VSSAAPVHRIVIRFVLVSIEQLGGNVSDLVA
jgi:hypothetical protein